MNISDRLKALSDSPTIVMTQKSRELRAEGIDIITLSIGEPDFDTPNYIKEAAKQAIDNNFSHYPPVAGFDDLKQAFVKKLKRDNHLDYTTSQIVVSAGAKHSIYNVLMTLLNSGDEVIIPTPYWVSYTEMVKLAEGKSVFVETNLEQNFKITPEQLEAAITEKTKVLMLCTPSNPTGSIYSKDELNNISKVLEKYKDIIIISDEIYEHINYVGKHESITQFPEMKERTVIINGVSKGYAMTGWRIGVIAAPQWIANACNKFQGQVTSGVSSIAQKASVAAFNNDDKSEIEKMRIAFEKRRNAALTKMDEIKGFKYTKPEGAFYLFPEVSQLFGKSYNGFTINNSNDLSLYILENAHVATVSGDAFGAPNYLRLSYAVSEERIIEALERIRLAINKLS